MWVDIPLRPPTSETYEQHLERTCKPDNRCVTRTHQITCHGTRPTKLILYHVIAITSTVSAHSLTHSVYTATAQPAHSVPDHCRTVYCAITCSCQSVPVSPVLPGSVPDCSDNQTTIHQQQHPDPCHISILITINVPAPLSEQYQCPNYCHISVLNTSIPAVSWSLP